MKYIHIMSVPCNLNCLDGVNLARPFWAAAKFRVRFSALGCWTNRTSKNVQSDLKYIYMYFTKAPYTRWMTILCQGDFKEQTEKLISLLLYTTENC